MCTARMERVKPDEDLRDDSVLLSTGDVLVTSGAQSAEVLDLGSSSSRVVPGGFPEAYRFATATALLNGDVFIAGGYADDNEKTAGVWRFRRR
jgi:hypothetical protein